MGMDRVGCAAVVRAVMEFACVKATEAISVSDKLFAQNWGAMKTAGIMRGAYHFFHPAHRPRTRPIISLKSWATYQQAPCRHHWTWKKPAKLTTSAGHPFGGADRPGLAVAHYKSTQTPAIPPQRPTWTFWQFSETGSVFGVNNRVDLNRFNGLSPDLKRLGKGAALGAVTT